METEIDEYAQKFSQLEQTTETLTAAVKALAAAESDQDRVRELVECVSLLVTSVELNHSIMIDMNNIFSKSEDARD